MENFEGKVVIVTGGAKGIGRGICLAFAAAGASVVCVDIDVSAGQDLVQEAAAKPGTLLFQEGDVAIGERCREVVDRAVSTWGGVDILCNNAGIQPGTSYMPAHELPEAVWDRILNVNLKSFYLMARFCVPVMKQRGGGVIVNMASVQGLQSAKGVSAYAASKGGVLSLTRQLALEYAEERIRVVAICPGAIDTPMLQEAGIEDMGALHKMHPIGRIGQPEDIAQAVLFLASDRASFITGEALVVDGGLMAKGAWA